MRPAGRLLGKCRDGVESQKAQHSERQRTKDYVRRDQLGVVERRQREMRTRDAVHQCDHGQHQEDREQDQLHAEQSNIDARRRLDPEEIHARAE